MLKIYRSESKRVPLKEGDRWTHDFDRLTWVLMIMILNLLMIMILNMMMVFLLVMIMMFFNSFIMDKRFIIIAHTSVCIFAIIVTISNIFAVFFNFISIAIGFIIVSYIVFTIIFIIIIIIISIIIIIFIVIFMIIHLNVKHSAFILTFIRLMFCFNFFIPFCFFSFLNYNLHYFILVENHL